MSSIAARHEQRTHHAVRLSSFDPGARFGFLGTPRADQILVVEAGRIVERGTHGELLAARGRY